MKIKTTEYTLIHNGNVYLSGKVYDVSDEIGKELLTLDGIKEVTEEKKNSDKKSNEKGK